MKVCSRCKMLKDSAEFNKQSEKSDGLQSHCKQCSRAYYKNYYNSSDRERIRLREKRKRELKEKREFLRDAKARPCTDCGQQYPYFVMDFDHIANKSFTISQSLPLYSLKRLKDEVAKCEVVCANCHRMRTHEHRLTENS